MAVIAAGLAARLAWLAATRFTFEDAFITFQFAKRLSGGEGFVYNPGEPIYGTTTPLFTLLLAGWLKLFPGHPVAGATLLDLAASAGALALTWAALTRLGVTPRARLWAIGALAICDKLWLHDAGGMETPLLLCLMAASGYAALRGWPVRGGIARGLPSAPPSSRERLGRGSRRNFPQGADARSHLGISPGPIEQQRGKPCRARGLVIFHQRVADVKNFRRQHPHAPARSQEDLGLGLARLLDGRDGDRPEPTGEPQPFQKRRQIGIPVGDDGHRETSVGERVERGKDVVEDPPGRGIAKVDHQAVKRHVGDGPAVQMRPHAVQKRFPEAGFAADSAVAVPEILLANGFPGTFQRVRKRIPGKRAALRREYARVHLLDGRVGEEKRRPRVEEDGANHREVTSGQ